MQIWNTSGKKQRELGKMLNEWAIHILGEYKNTKLSSSIYLSEAEPFLEQYAKRSPANMVLIGSAGNFIKAEDFMAIVGEGQDEEGNLEKGQEHTPMSPQDTIPKREGLIVFFPGIPGCAKSALCREILKTTGEFGDDRPVHSLMGDLIKGNIGKRLRKNVEKDLTQGWKGQAFRGLYAKGTCNTCSQAKPWYAQFLNRGVPVEITALLFSDKLAALEACVGTVEGERIKPMNEWPHITLWTAPEIPPKEANLLPQLHSEGKATSIEIHPPITISGPLKFHRVTVQFSNTIRRVM